MSVSPKSERSREKSPENLDSTSEPVKKSSKYVMTCGTPSPPKSPEISTKNAQNYTSFSISSILSKQDSANEKSHESKSTGVESNLSTNQLQSAAGFMSHISGAAALHPCSTDSLMLSRYVRIFEI